MTLYALPIESPLGQLTLVASDDALVAVEFPGRAPRGARGAGHPVLERAREQLGEYFQGRRTAFDLPLAPPGTPFQRAVWKELCAIPFGQTLSYGELARRVGRPGAARAVGAANGQNPIAIIVPCHRVIGADGSLTGYGGGVERKRWLLAHERAAALPARQGVLLLP